MAQELETELRLAEEERAEHAALADCVLALEAGAREELGLGVVEHSELGVEEGPRAAWLRVRLDFRRRYLESRWRCRARSLRGWEPGMLHWRGRRRSCSWDLRRCWARHSRAANDIMICREDVLCTELAKRE